MPDPNQPPVLPPLDDLEGADLVPFLGDALAGADLGAFLNNATVFMVANV